MTIPTATCPGLPPVIDWIKDRIRGAATSHVVEADREETYLAVAMPAAECGEPAFARWRAELKLAECSRTLPLAWPLPDWLGDYRDLLTTALARQTTVGCAIWQEKVRAFLQLMLTGNDKSAADLIRTLTRLHPFAAETRRIRRVQALFAAIRPALSLVDALDRRILAKSETEAFVRPNTDRRTASASDRDFLAVQ